MPIINILIAFAIGLVALVGCGSPASPDAEGLVMRSRQVWGSNWHAVWQIEWSGAPVGGPLTVEVWHAADGRLRIETLEAPTAALSGLTLVDDGATVWVYDARQNQAQAGSGDQVRIPLASDALTAIDWLLSEMDNGTVRVSGHDTLESGSANQLAVTLDSGDRATLWVQDATGLPARIELRSAIWGEATFTTRSINTTQRLHPALFVVPNLQDPDVHVVK